MVSLTSASLLVRTASGDGGLPSELERVPAVRTQGRSRRPPLTPLKKNMVRVPCFRGRENARRASGGPGR